MPAPTPTVMRQPLHATPELRRRIETIIDQLDHVLPGQAPILNFIHHNTLHGFQHLPFAEALVEGERLNGICGYLPETEFRCLHKSGRIDDEDLRAVIDQATDLAPDEILWRSAKRTIRRRDIFWVAIVHGIEPITVEQLRWSIEELNALDRIQSDVPPTARHGLLESIKRHHGGEGLTAPGQPLFIRELWKACLMKLGLEESNLHPEEITDLSVQHAERLLAAFGTRVPGQTENGPVAGRLLTEQNRKALAETFRRIGEDRSLRDLLLDLTGEDLLCSVRPILIRYAGSFLDEGLAAWHAPARGKGFYRVWRDSISHEWRPDPADADVHRKILAELTEDPVDTLIGELQRIGLAPERWQGYLTRIALELPGWSGMMNWRATHPDYPANSQSPVHLVDYLAVRLVLDRIRLTRICREQWGIRADVPSLEHHFESHLAEFSVRLALFRDALPEYLAAAAQQLVADSRNGPSDAEAWRRLADMIFTWNQRNANATRAPHSTHGSAWRLFRLAQHLGLTAPDIAALSLDAAERLLNLLDTLTPRRRAHLWLEAYERHYREEIFNALSANHGLGRWVRRHERPEAQLVFCMDDREESIRRHLEEVNPGIETLGAAGFFGVAMYWRGLDDENATALCPIVVTPAHEVREIPTSGQEQVERHHRRRLRFARFLRRIVNQESRRNLISSHLLIDFLAPVHALGLIGKTLYARRQHRFQQSAASSWITRVSTELALTAQDDGLAATSDEPRMGFAEGEQADRVAALLRNIGLIEGLAPLVVMIGHGSTSQNNPHLAAYDCGACSGRHGGPNARAFAAMANRPGVRALLSKRGIAIPPDTWFLGAEHNTGDEEITWFDAWELPPILRPALHKLKLDLDLARRRSAHERCRRFASAPRHLTPNQALRHVLGRAADFSQARPELGHATNAAAFIGRRSISQGVFFDRRTFLISYDPTSDPKGTTLEGILLAVGPVGAGISLEYYFSTVDHERFGCGTKVPHNVTGLFGVMEGTSSDLRTGLPRQMTEIHEAMRLLVILEQKPEILVAIYERQESLRQLIGNEWIRLASIDPDDGSISLFDARQGFVPWTTKGCVVPICKSSMEWYDGRDDPLPPALIRAEGTITGAVSNV